jgi:hypothetical protein
MYDEESEDDICICNHPNICFCVFELDWMRDLVNPIFLEGYEDGVSEGIDEAIQHTIYGQLPVEEPFLYDDELPPSSFIDPCRYRRAYAKGFREAYDNTYQRHRPVLQELELIHLVQHFTTHLLLRFRAHKLLDPRLFHEIRQFVYKK